MELLERALEAVNRAGSRLEHHHDLGLVRQFVLPAVERPGRWQNRAAGNEAPIEQCPNERRGFVSIGECGENDDSVSVPHVSDPVRW